MNAAAPGARQIRRAGKETCLVQSDREHALTKSNANQYILSSFLSTFLPSFRPYVFCLPSFLPSSLFLSIPSSFLHSTTFLLSFLLSFRPLSKSCPCLAGTRFQKRSKVFLRRFPDPHSDKFTIFFLKNSLIFLRKCRRLFFRATPVLFKLTRPLYL